MSATPWSFEFECDVKNAVAPFFARLRYGSAVLTCHGSTATNAIMGLLRQAETLSDPVLRDKCVGAIRRGTGRESDL